MQQQQRRRQHCSAEDPCPRLQGPQAARHGRRAAQGQGLGLGLLGLLGLGLLGLLGLGLLLLSLGLLLLGLLLPGLLLGVLGVDMALGLGRCFC